MNHKSSMRVILLVLVLGSWATPSCATALQSEQPMRLAGHPRHEVLYEITKNRARVYLFGTIHLGKAELYPFGQHVLRALDRATVLAMEEVDSDQKAQEQAFARVALYPPNTNLESSIAPSLMTRTARALDQLDIPRQQAVRLRPLALAWLMSVKDMSVAGYRPELSNESVLSGLAKAKGMLMEAVEPAGSAIELEFGLPTKGQIEYLEQSLSDIETRRNRRDWDTLVRAWLRGDERSLVAFRHAQFARLPQDVRSYQESVLNARSLRMERRLETYLNSERNYFFAVGILHVVGDHGIVALLKKDGYKVKLVVH